MGKCKLKYKANINGNLDKKYSGYAKGEPQNLALEFLETKGILKIFLRYMIRIVHKKKAY